MIFDMTKRVGEGGGYTIAPYNLLNGVALTDGFIAAGGWESPASNNYKEKVTGYLPVPEDADGKFWFTSGFGAGATSSAAWWGIGFYDANQEFISRPATSGTTGSIAIPSNAVYARFSFRTGGDFTYAVFKTQAEYNQYVSLYPLLKNSGASYVS